MGKKGKKKAKKGSQKTSSSETKEDAPKSRISMADLEAMSDGSEGELPPEQEWDEETRALKEAILGGQFDHLLKREDGGQEDDDASIEEVELNSSSDDDAEVVQGDEDAVSGDEKEEGNENLDSEEASEVSENVVEKRELAADSEKSDSESIDVAQADDPKNDKKEGCEEKADKKDPSISEKNQSSSKALHIVTEELRAEKREWHWAETFDIVPPTPLSVGSTLDIHDDLKREVAFYDLALEAVQQGRKKCQQAGIPFSRPGDFFAEMVKSDGE